ncbi:MAG: hypothetical protein ACQETB_03260 [Halobacteriota archaeon]
MASATQLESNTSVRHTDATSTSDRFKTHLGRGVRFASFWLAILLPFVYFPLLASEPNATTAVTFLGLLGVNLLALKIGHGYNQE